MGFLGRVMSSGSRFLARVAPAAQFIGRVGGQALSAMPAITSGIVAASNNPMVNALANKMGV
jgi:hypothetical protein